MMITLAAGARRTSIRVVRMETWQSLSGVVAQRLAAASSSERKVFAAGVAERLLGAHEALPEGERAPFTLSLRPLLNSVWEGALGDTTAFKAVNRAMAGYMLSEYCHNDGQDGPDDADEDAAATVLLAANSYLYGVAEFAVWASRRAVEIVHRRAESHSPGQILAHIHDGVDLPDLENAPVPDLLAELRRQLRDLDLIAGWAEHIRYSQLGLPIDVSIRLRVELRGPLSVRD
ncbi:hypothetical protein ACFVUY_36575 [Kitasatospora sp. NPDC058063]|uniref:hypothetical protein n=1 Tax=unclassified Kitasatospora TaxID=2633591 RepID=UPI0036DC44F4